MHPYTVAISYSIIEYSQPLLFGEYLSANMGITEKIIAGIVSMKKLTISYKDGTETKQYTVLPHLLGKYKSTGNIVLSAYSEDEIKPCWKTFLLANITVAKLADENFERTAPNYNAHDKRISAIICAIPSFQ